MNRGLWKAVASMVVANAMLLGATSVRAQHAELNLMPMPARIELGNGALKIDREFSVAFAGYREARLDRAGQRFLAELHKQTGIVFVATSAEPSKPSKATLVVTTKQASKPVQELGEDESYVLDVTPAGAKLDAANPLGVLRGLQTFLQLAALTPEGFALPAVHIQDQPRFPWRGLLIDSGRHFIPMEVLKRNLDGMEAVKMNVFHWHVSDNQGFRVESRKYPKLHEQGSDGLFYTQEQIRDFVAYARDRGIRIVPEFDMPGHTTSWFVGYPELASGGGPYTIERRWGVHDPAMDPTSEGTYKFLNEFLSEMTKLFPDAFFHTGGDEVNGKAWQQNPKIQEYMKAHGFADTQALQAYFSRRVQELVVKHGKIPVGWDEVLIPGVPKNIVIQSWHGPESLIAAAKQGYRGILSGGYYLDLGWSAARHYAEDPMGGGAAELTADQKQLILGGESCMWSEFVSAENIDSRVWPRNAAIAERLWSAENVTDPASMYRRLEAESARLEWLGLTHTSAQRHMIRRIAGPASPGEAQALHVLAAALEPVKEYTREENATVPPTSQSAMNRLVDAVDLESEVSRHFSWQVDKFVAGSCQDEAGGATLRSQLQEWAGNDAHLRLLIQRSFLVKEAAPASSALSQAAELALGALDRITQGLPLPDKLKQQQIEALNAFELQAHKSQLTLPARAAFQKLIETAAAGCGGSK